MTSNNRASLLSGLRTGGVRSASGPIAPHTAAIGGSFQIPRFASGHHQAPLYEEPSDFQSLHYAHNPLGMPMTAGLVDGLTPRFSQQQQAPHSHQAQHHQLLRQAQIAAMSGMQGLGQPMDPNQHLLQMQFMQAMVLQQQQAQRLQAEIALQQQVAMSLAVQQEQQHIRSGSRIPSTAGPTQTTFDQRIPVPQMRNLRLDAHNNADDIGPVPMTAALGGKFGGRPTSSFKQSDEQSSSSSTVVISGGVSLGAPSQTQTTAPSKSDAATSWRRGSAAVGSARNVSPPKLEPTIATPTVTVSAPEESSKPSPTDPATVLPKYRPQPLRIHNNGSATNSTPTLVVESDDGQSAIIAGPPSPASSQSSLEAPAKRYDGLGIGRPVVVPPATASVRASQPVRQPRGPPAGADDLGTKNFASRIKRAVVVPMKEAAIVEAY